MGVYDELSKLSVPSPTQSVEKPSERIKEPIKKTKKKKQKHVDQPVDQWIGQSVNQSTDQSTNQSTNQLTGIDEIGPVVGRPCAFYITQKVDSWLDEAVRYLRDKGFHKVDRSVLVNALLHDATLYKHKSLDKLRGRLLLHLTNRNLKRVQSTE